MKDHIVKKILVIDDEIYIRDSVNGFFEDFGGDGVIFIMRFPEHWGNA